jgi:hypothetical protein
LALIHNILRHFREELRRRTIVDRPQFLTGIVEKSAESAGRSSKVNMLDVCLSDRSGTGAVIVGGDREEEMDDVEDNN